ncbi:Transcriptional regulator, PadR family [Salinispira pacifica]|uniref:Transcriptional regulator, PadR family n=1 Tax=Salinispira pacifica TaxID=1307761 RepID=V5WHT7_9SPIO|nr:Transcriptional regulator, PadR family [Salinispira pacifica]
MRESNRGGIVDFVVLGLIMLGAQTIYDMNAAVKAGISLFYSASYGSIQAAIAKLLREGKIEIADYETEGRRRKRYGILPAGREAFYEWMMSIPSGTKLEVQILSRVYFAGLLPDDDGRKHLGENIRTAINNGLEELLALEKTLDSMDVSGELQEVFRYQRATLRYGIESHTMARSFFERELP